MGVGSQHLSADAVRTNLSNIIDKSKRRHADLAEERRRGRRSRSGSRERRGGGDDEIRPTRAIVVDMDDESARRRPNGSEQNYFRHHTNNNNNYRPNNQDYRLVLDPYENGASTLREFKIFVGETDIGAITTIIRNTCPTTIRHNKDLAIIIIIYRHPQDSIR